MKLGVALPIIDIGGEPATVCEFAQAAEQIGYAAPDAVKQVMEATGGGAAAAIDFVGSPKTMEFGVNILRKGGKLVMVGLYGGAHPISTVLFPFRMMTLEGSYVGTLEDLRELLAGADYRSFAAGSPVEQKGFEPLVPP